MATPNDYYDVLGVSRTASVEEIRRAYRKLARQFHPDVNKSPDAARRFNEVQEAYDVLSDAEKRQGYDRFGRSGVGASSARPGSHSGRTVWTRVSPEDFGAADFGDVFEEIFSGSAGGWPFSAASSQRPSHVREGLRRGRDLEHTLAVTFLTAALGGTEQVRVGTNASSSTISVKIPPGIESGGKLRVTGKGQPGQHGGPPGDLILTVLVGKHPYFRREGLDILIDVPISLTEAAMGTSVTVPLLPPRASGGSATVEIKVPPGTSSGQKLRVRGKGITDSRNRIGDFYAVIQIVTPSLESLSKKGRKLLSDLAGELKNPRESASWADDLGDARRERPH